MRHLAIRTRPLIALVTVALVLLAACSSDSGSKPRSKSKPSAPPSTQAPVTLAADPAACLRGTYRFTRMDYAGPVQTAFGPTTIVGGIGGRRIELRPDNTFHFTDSGAEQVQFSVQNQSGTTKGTAILKAQADGIYVPTADTSTFDITALSGTLALTFQDGSVVNIPLPPNGAGVKETFGLNGNASYTCDAKSVTVRFPTLTIGLERV
jgi:hypothetical protein